MKLQDLLNEDLRQDATFGVAPRSKYAAIGDIKPSAALTNRRPDPSRVEYDYDNEDEDGNFKVKPRVHRSITDIDRKAMVPQSLADIGSNLGMNIVGSSLTSTRPDLLVQHQQLAAAIDAAGTKTYDNTDEMGRTRRKYEFPDGEVWVYNNGNNFPYVDKSRKDKFYDYLNFTWTKK